MKRLRLSILIFVIVPAVLQADTRCAVCHPKIAASYAKTGMARSFYKPDTRETEVFEHKPSGVTYSMGMSGGRYVQTQTRGVESSESTVDYVMGSGNHVRTFLHKTERGTLVELPLAWYAEKGGIWAMNPGHDRDYALPPRQVAYECMFCHNAYPAIPRGNEERGSEPLFAGELPEGINCERCHGTGDKHIASGGARGTIVNPAKLSGERQMEVCMQCHLETTSHQLPHSIVKFDRTPFSYVPGEPLADFELLFDYKAGDPRKDEFEIAHSAYRLRQSKCFLQSKGAMTCTTCHDPHDVPRAAAATLHYNSVCAKCHTKLSGHAVRTDCIECHMPKRRAEDVIHAVMTDHFIQRRPPIREVTAERNDAPPYRGAVMPYYPTNPDPLYLALAQVSQGSNPGALSAFESQMAAGKPVRPEFYIELGQAQVRARAIPKAVQSFRTAVAMEPGSAVAALNLGDALTQAGDTDGAAAELRRALRLHPGDPLLWYQLGIAGGDAAAYSKAVELDPNFADAWNALGEARAGAGDMGSAEAAFRKALGIHVDMAEAMSNLGHVLAARGDLDGAVVYLARAVKLRPDDAETRVNYGSVLMGLRRNSEARHEFEEALRLRPGFDLAVRNLRRLPN